MRDSDSADTPEAFRDVFDSARRAVARAVVGHDEVIDQILICLFAGGHCLLEGAPGLGKTLLVRSVAAALELPFSRIQFTPDLMPADILGTDVLVERESGGTGLEFRAGPIFGAVVLADEVNRATPKTQSAMLQAMEEGEVTVARRTHVLPDPFMILATQNPLEMEGTYPLPEAQLDRFFVKIAVESPSLPDLLRIVDMTTGEHSSIVEKVADADTVRSLRRLARGVVIAPHLRDYLGRLVLATHPQTESATELVRRVVRFGASPRAAQSLALGSKVRAISRGRAHVTEDDLRTLARPVLRHRVLLNFEGEADGITSEDVVTDLLKSVRA
jgi:MoxR-like ATPase